MDKKERIKNKIVKLYEKYTKMQKNPSKISMFAFIPLAFISAFGLSLLGNLIVPGAITTMIAILSGIGITMGAVYNFSGDYHDIRLNRIQNKLLDLEYVLTEKYGFDKDGNILCVPADKVRDYLDGKYILTKSYYVEYKDAFASLTTQEIEDLRSKGFEFHKNIDRLKALSPEQVKKLLSKGYTISRDGIETIFTKDGKKLQLDCNEASYIFPSYEMKLSKFQQRDKENLIACMTAKNKSVEKGAKKDEMFDYETGIDLNLD